MKNIQKFVENTLVFQFVSFDEKNFWNTHHINDIINESSTTALFWSLGVLH